MGAQVSGRRLLTLRGIQNLKHPSAVVFHSHSRHISHDLRCYAKKKKKWPRSPEDLAQTPYIPYFQGHLLRCLARITHTSASMQRFLCWHTSVLAVKLKVALWLSSSFSQFTFLLRTALTRTQSRLSCSHSSGV